MRGAPRLRRPSRRPTGLCTFRLSSTYQGGGGGLYLCAPLMAMFGLPGLAPLAGTAGGQTSAHQVKLLFCLSPSLGLVPVEVQHMF